MISPNFEFALASSLRYVNSIGTGSITSLPSTFVVSSEDTSKYLIAEQSFEVSISGLRPGTTHKAYLNGIDVTALCKQQGRMLGDGLISTGNEVGGYYGNLDSGTINFIFYYQSHISPTTPVEQAAALTSLIGGQKVLIISSVDGSSTANINISLPKYAKEEPNILIKKLPTTSVDSVASATSIVETSKITPTNTYFNPINFSMIQSFYADPAIVNKSSEVNLTSIDLFFKTKPSTIKNSSGSITPGVSIAICEFDNDTPKLDKTYSSSLVYKKYDAIYAYADASTGTTFGFKEPIKLATGKFYGVVIIFEDPGYALWVNKTGDKLVNTNTPSPGVNSVKDGKMYLRNNAGIFNSISDTDIKINIRCAKYTSTSDSKVYVNKDYEFLTVDTKVGNFLGGEYVYQNTAPSVGLVSLITGSNTIVGTNTLFLTSIVAGQQIVVVSGVDKQILTVSQVANDTFISVDSVVPFTNTIGNYITTVIGKITYQDWINNKVYLSDSTSSSLASKFFANNTIIGVDSKASANIVSIDNISIDRARLRGNVVLPASGNIDTILKATVLDNGTFKYSENNAEKISINNSLVHDVNKYDAYVLSRSNEIGNPSPLFSILNQIDNKSLKIEANYSVSITGDVYQTPALNGTQLNLYTVQNKVSNTYTTVVGGVTIDTEVNGNGLAVSKHITSKVQFDSNKFAEDIRMFMVAYRPIGTDLKVYARLHNSADPEAFDDKSWTPLDYVSNENNFSSSDDKNNFIEYELNLPPFSESANALPGTFTSQYANNIIVSNNVTPNTYIQTNDVIKIYNPSFPVNDYQVCTVTSANLTHIVLGSKISTNNVVGTGYKVDKLKYPNIAFNNINNTNVSRYYNGALTEFDTFDSMQIKIVMLADTSYLVPRIDQIQVMGVSA